MKEVFHETYGVTGLITNGHFEEISAWKNPHHRYFKDDHDPAAGDYEPNQRDKQRILIEVKQRADTLVWMRDVRKKTDNNLQ